MALLGTVKDFESVRAAVDLSLTEAEVPDYVVALPVFQGAAEAEVLARDPLAASRTGADLQRVRRAAVFLTAALLAPSVAQIVGETLGDVRLTAAPVDTAALAASLRRRADAELVAVLGAAALTTHRPVLFALATASRGY